MLLNDQLLSTCSDVQGIPEDFVCKYGKDLSNPVCFKLPCGSEWEVGLTRYNGEVWFKRGWPDFLKFSSLGYNDMLVFGYEGHSRYQVSIFDRSTIEIEYPIEHSKIEESKEDFPVKKEWGGTPSTQRFQKRTPEVHQKANAFKSHNPSFKMSIRHSYINQNLSWLPLKFGRTHLTKQPSSSLLRVLGGRKTCEDDFDENDEGIEDNDNENGSDDADEDEDNEGEEDDDSIEILDHFPLVIKRKEKSPLASRLHKRRRTNSCTKAQSNMKHVGGCWRTQKSLNRRPEVHKKIHPVKWKVSGNI
ncbi:hypothetical protein M0R45_001970 [Rubus argutus]|uniref:TF-B3 domain-containing protein n=1 Tax=Rubus argutus TaxID=59490 RepID=A0AAW1VG53_RUBAR